MGLVQEREIITNNPMTKTTGPFLAISSPFFQGIIPYQKIPPPGVRRREVRA
jgi:hypothetical protein